MTAPEALARARIDVDRLNRLLAPHALRILNARRMEHVGNPNAAEVAIRNRNPKRQGGKARGDVKPSASWNPAKGLFKDFGDARFDGDLIHVVAQRRDLGVHQL